MPKLQLHDAIYRLRFYSNSLIHILSLSNLHNSVTSIQKNRGDKSHRVIVALDRQSLLFSVTFRPRMEFSECAESSYLKSVAISKDLSQPLCQSKGVRISETRHERSMAGVKLTNIVGPT